MTDDEDSDPDLDEELDELMFAAAGEEMLGTDSAELVAAAEEWLDALVTESGRMPAEVVFTGMVMLAETDLRRIAALATVAIRRLA